MGDAMLPGTVAIVGLGAVGATAAYALMNAGAASEIILISRDRAKVEGEVMDLNHGSSFVPPVTIRAGDYEDCARARIVIITAGVRQEPGESRMDLLGRNLEVMQDVIPRIIANNVDCILLMVTNPVDALTYASLKLSGLPSARVMGTGTLLDTSRFRSLLSVHCGVAAENVHAYILGEHGDSEVAAWSATTIAGAPFDAFCANCPRRCSPPDRESIFLTVKNAAYEIIAKKGATFYAIGLAIRRIVQAILRDESVVLPVSSFMSGAYGITDVCLSLPSIINGTGIKRVFELPLAGAEKQALQDSARVLKGILRSAGV